MAAVEKLPLSSHSPIRKYSMPLYWWMGLCFFACFLFHSVYNKDIFNNTIIERSGFMRLEDIQHRLLQLDEDADLMFEEDQHFICIIVGGSAFVLLGYSTRVTHDIDMLRASPELNSLLQKYDMNTNVQAYLDNFPDDCWERLKPIPLQTQRINFYTLALEDLIVSKLAASRGQDIADISSDEVIRSIDWNQLSKSANILRQGMLNERTQSEFDFAFHTYWEKYHHETTDF